MPWAHSARGRLVASVLYSTMLLLNCNLHAAESITLEDAITATVTRNPDLLAFGYEMRAQDGRIRQAGLSPKPELTIAVEDVFGTGVAQALSGAQTTASIAWVIEGDLRQRRIDAARTGSLVLAAEAEVMRLDAAAETARHFTRALGHQLHIVAADQAVALAQESVEVVGQRVRAATTLASEMARAQAELAKRELHREDLNHELSGTYHELAAQWGELVPQFSHVDGDPLLLPALAPFADLLVRIEQNPDISRYLSEQRMHEAVVQLEEAQRNSLWRFNAGVRRIESSSDLGFVAGVTIPLQRGNQNQGRIAEARARLEQSTAEQQATRIRIQTSLRLMYQALEHSLHRAQTLRSDVIPRYEDALLEVRRAYELGSTPYMEWLQVQDELLDARKQLIDASIQAQLHVIEIERLTGVRVNQVTPTLSP
ncbi:MAG: TolC family protein [Gammaproteobacteria bacterium]|nr:TolC family protein [Gammaproteobacteria bacterium]MDP2142480.1 TolC family protein [Gammaproteobacteria bacterium]MDP2346462.1 TolC family protein [Gammaproteobacteria bacterium]